MCLYYLCLFLYLDRFSSSWFLLAIRVDLVKVNWRKSCTLLSLYTIHLPDNYKSSHLLHLEQRDNGVYFINVEFCVKFKMPLSLSGETVVKILQSILYYRDKDTVTIGNHCQWQEVNSDTVVYLDDPDFPEPNLLSLRGQSCLKQLVCKTTNGHKWRTPVSAVTDRAIGLAGLPCNWQRHND